MSINMLLKNILKFKQINKSKYPLAGLKLACFYDINKFSTLKQNPVSFPLIEISVFCSSGLMWSRRLQVGEVEKHFPCHCASSASSHPTINLCFTAEKFSFPFNHSGIYSKYLSGLWVIEIVKIIHESTDTWRY